MENQENGLPEKKVKNRFAKVEAKYAKNIARVLAARAEKKAKQEGMVKLRRRRRVNEDEVQKPVFSSKWVVPQERKPNLL